MFKKIKLLIIIPAREGSKTIKNKNLIKLYNKHLIFYTIKFAKKFSEKNKLIFCSTDSSKIKKIVKNYGLETPFLRPKKYSRDVSRDLEFVNHTLKEYNKIGINFEIGLILRPTSPIRNLKDIKKAYKMFLQNKKADSMRTVTYSKNNPYKTWVVKKKYLVSIMNSKIKEHYNAPRQILPKTFWQTGNFEFFKINFKKKLNSISGKQIMPYFINGESILDIDTISDIENIKKNTLL